MSNWHFSENPVFEQIAEDFAKKIFGGDWMTTTRTTHQEPNGMMSRESWKLSWYTGEIDKHFHISTTKDGKLEGINNKTPAVFDFKTDGTLINREFYRDGRLENPEPMVAAVENYCPDSGNVCVKSFYSSGRLNNLEDGYPASTKYYENGAVMEIWLMEDGKIKDSVYGEPAVLFYGADGDIDGGISSMVSVRLCSVETAARLKMGKERRAMELCGGETTVAAGKSNWQAMGTLQGKVSSLIVANGRTISQ